MYKRFLHTFIVTAVLIAFVLPVTPVGASGESITNFKSNIILTDSSQATVTETITYNFGPNERRGIIRDIPTRYRLDDGQGFEVEFELISVSRQDKPNERYEINKSGQGISLRVGDPNVYLTGSKTYEIIYTLSPVVLDLDDEDVFRFDVTGTDWSVPILNVEATLHTEMPALSTDCYSGTFGSQDRECGTKVLGPGSYNFTAQSLSAGDGLTIEAVYEPGSFLAYPELRDWDELAPGLFGTSLLMPFILLGGFILLVLSLVGGAVASYIKYRSRRKRQLVITQYEPPADFTPAEVGLLNDNISNTVEFTATLIDLAIRGYVSITQIDKKGFFSKQDYELELLKPYDDLKDYERDLMSVLFGTSNKVKLSELNSTTMQAAISKMHKTLVSRLEESGHYRPKISWYKKLKDVRSGKTGVTLVSVVMTLVAILLLFVAPFLLLLLLVLPSVYASWKGGGALYSRVTKHGFMNWAHIEGFKDFLAMTQKERLAFHDAPDRRPEQFSEYLPYAVALGVEKQWAKQFEGINVVSNQNWYHSSNMGAMPATLFASQLASGLNSFAKSNYASSSSGGSGGGFSGGGVGGGGGGSW